MNKRSSIWVLGLVFSIAPTIGFSGAKIGNPNPFPGGLTLLPGPSLLSPSRQQSAGIQPQLSLGETPSLQLPRSPSQPRGAVPTFDKQLSTPQAPLSLLPSRNGGTTMSGTIGTTSLSGGPGVLTFNPESRWTMIEEDAELKEARANFEAAKSRLDKLLAERAEAKRRKSSGESQRR